MLIGGIVGDGSTLARVFPGGAISALYGPGIASPRHIIQSNLGIFWKDERRFMWLTGMDGLCAQTYEAGAGLLITRFHYDDLRVELRDFVDPETHVLVRRARVTNPQPRQLSIRLFHLEASSIAENKEEFAHNMACFERGFLVRYRGHAFDNLKESPLSVTFGFTPPPDAWQVGVSYRRDGADRDAHLDVDDGELQGNVYAFHHDKGVTSALGWDLSLAHDETFELAVCFAPDRSFLVARDRIALAQLQSAAELEAQVTASWTTWAETGPGRARLAEQHRERQWWDLSLGILRMLQDRDTGAIIAAPSVNPDYRYCWPRDAALITDALSGLGFVDEASRFLCWAERAQAEDGNWYQNYYVDGRRHWPALQVDQVGSVVWAMCRHLERHGHQLLERLWPSIARATEALAQRVAADEFHLAWSEQDLWEETGGYFAYTNASVIAAFREAALLASRTDHEDEATRWGAAELRTRDAFEERFIEQGAFVAALDPDAARPSRDDCRIDVSMLGVVFPFGIVDPRSAVVTKTMENLIAAFNYEAGGLGRYPSDRFFGGNPWPLADLWLAHVLRLRGELELAHQRLEHVARRMTPLGFIPEQNQKQSGEPTSVIPLGWAHAWLLQYLLHSH